MSTLRNMQVDSIASMDTVGERIRVAMKGAGLNQSELARAIGLTRAAVSKAINNVSMNIRASTLISIEKATGYSSAWIATGKGEQKLKTYDGTTFSQLSESEQILAVKMLVSELKAEGRLEILKTLLSDTGADT